MTCTSFMYPFSRMIKYIKDCLIHFLTSTNLLTFIHDKYIQYTKSAPEQNSHPNYQSIASQIFGIHWIKNWEKLKPEINLRTKLNIIFCQIIMKMWHVNLIGVRTVLRILQGRQTPRIFKVFVKFWLCWRYIRIYLCGVMRWFPSPSILTRGLAANYK